MWVNKKIYACYITRTHNMCMKYIRSEKVDVLDVVLRQLQKKSENSGRNKRLKQGWHVRALF